MPTTLEAQRRYWEGLRERRSPTHPAVRAFAAPKLDFIRKNIAVGVRSMLEVGAGNGYLSVPLAELFELTCLDFSANMLAKNPLPAERKRQGRAEELPFPDASFDVVLCANLLHHLEDPARAVREMRRVARRHVILVEPNAKNPMMFAFGVLKKSERGTLKFNRAYLRELGERAGLVLRAESVQGFVLPNKTPAFALPLLRRVDGASVLGFYCLGVFDKV